MFIEDLALDYRAVVIAALLYFIWGCIWYAPSFFGKYCYQNNEVCKRGAFCMTRALITEFVLDLFMAFVLAIFIRLSQVDELFTPFDQWKEVKEGALVGFLAWLGFVLPTQFSEVIWTKKHFTHFLFHTVFALTGLMLMGITIIYITPTLGIE